MGHKLTQASPLFITLVACLFYACMDKSNNDPIQNSRGSPKQPVTDGETPPPGSDSPGNPVAPPCVHDCVPMVYISPGTFSMGATHVPGESKPKHTVTLTKGFWIDKYEVSQKNYAKCLEAGVCPKPDGSFDANIDRAVYGVSWQVADSYCRWTGKRLPTEAEWERAACKEGEKCYPWGGEKLGETDCSEKPDCSRAAHCLQSGCAGGPCYDKPKNVYDFESTGNVSPYGVVNMAGNVWEWVQDSWTDNFNWCLNSCTDPLAPPLSEKHVMKGGSWISEEVFLRCSARYEEGKFPNFEVGIRCAHDASL